MRLLTAVALCTAFVGCTPAHPQHHAPGSEHSLIGQQAPASLWRTPSEANHILVEFWASWCEACGPSLDALGAFKQARGPSLQVLGLSIDEEESSFESYQKAHDHGVPLSWDKGQRLAAKLQIKKLPSLVVIDRRGTIRAIFSGDFSDNRAAVAELLK